MSRFNMLVVRFRQQPRWWRVSEWLLAAYLFYALLLGVITPVILESELPKALSETLGRQVTIKKISINPFLLRVRIIEFSIAEQQASNDFFRFDLLEVDGGFLKTLFSFTPTLEHIYLRGPGAQIIREQGGKDTLFNFSDIVAHLQAQSASQENTPADKTESKLPHIRLGLLRLSEGSIMLIDRVTGAELVYPELNFELTQLDTRASIPLKVRAEEEGAPENLYQIELMTDDGGQVHLDGLFQLAPLGVTGKVSLKNILLPPLWPLSEDVIEAKLTDGLLDFAVSYQLTETQKGVLFKAIDGQLRLSSVALSDTRSERIRVERVAVNQLQVNTDTQRVDIASLEIKAPFVGGEYDHNGLDLVSMFLPESSADSTSQPASATQQQSDSGWHVVLGEFSLSEGDIQLKDTAIAESMYWRVHPLEVSTGEIDTRLTAPVDFQIDVPFSGKPQDFSQQVQGRVSTEGAIDVATQAVTGELDITNVALSQFQSYVAPFATISLADGTLSTSGKYQANAEGAVEFNGEAVVANLTILDGLHNEPLLKWQSVDIEKLRFSTFDNVLEIAAVNFTEPYARLLIDEQKRTNIGAIIVKQKSSSAELDPEHTTQPETHSPEAKAPATMAVRIGAININNGSAYFSDKSLTPQFASSLESLNGTISKLSSAADTTAEVLIKGKIDSYAPVSLTGEINPLLDDMYLDVDFSVSGAELTSVNPYAGTYMGYYIDKGLLSLDVSYKIKDNALDGDNHVVIDQLTLGQKSESDQALNLPLGLAVALLQDNDGVIDLGLEVSGNLDNPDFNFGAIILNVLGNLITKAVTAPFTFLASLVGSEDDELNRIEFTAGQHVLNDEAMNRLATLAEALNKRPGLRMSIEGAVNAVSDAREMAAAMLHQNLLERSGLETLPENLSASNIALDGPIAYALEVAFVEQFNQTVTSERQRILAQLQNAQQETVTAEQITKAMHIAMYNQLRDKIDITEGQLADLAQNRAKAVKAYLVNQAQVAASRLFLLNSGQHLKAGSGSVELTLEAN